MIPQFFDLELEQKNPSDGMFLSGENELSLLLDGLVERPPFVIRLVGTNGYELGAGIGDPGFVQHLHTNGDSPCMVAVRQDAAPFDIRSDQSAYALACKQDDELKALIPTFLAGGTPTPIPTRYCLPFDGVKEIVLFFLKTGDRSPVYLWEAI